MTALHVRGRLLPGGAIRDVFIVDGRFTFTAQEDATTVSEGGYVLPGLVDAHAHLTLASPAPRDASPRQRAEASARAHLRAGVLVVREPGGPDRHSQGIGPATGLPRVQTGGVFLAPHGGYLPGLAREIAVDELPAAAEEEARASGAWAKVIGDFAGDDGRLRANFPVEVVRAAVHAVHELGARLAVHAVGVAAIDVAIEAGVDALEHGIMLRPDHIREMKRRDITYTPTLDIAPMVPGAFADLLEDGAMTDLQAALVSQPSRVREAHEAGVRILAGTDAGMGPHGMVREELRLLLEAGLPADVVLAAGSWDARRYLGLPGIEDGAPADLVVFRDDPHDPDELAHPELVILDGRVMELR